MRWVERASSEAESEKLCRELRLFRAAGAHPHIGAIAASLSDGRWVFGLVRRYYEDDVGAMMARALLLSLPLVQHVVRSILEGVWHLHAALVVHRDLRPQSIRVRMSGRGPPDIAITGLGHAIRAGGGGARDGGRRGRTGLARGRVAAGILRTGAPVGAALGELRRCPRARRGRRHGLVAGGPHDDRDAHRLRLGTLRPADGRERCTPSALDRAAPRGVAGTLARVRIEPSMGQLAGAQAARGRRVQLQPFRLPLARSPPSRYRRGASNVGSRAAQARDGRGAPPGRLVAGGGGGTKAADHGKAARAGGIRGGVTAQAGRGAPAPAATHPAAGPDSSRFCWRATSSSSPHPRHRVKGAACGGAASATAAATAKRRCADGS